MDWYEIASENPYGEPTHEFPDGYRFGKWDIRFMDMAELVSTWSKDPGTQVGAIAVEPGTRRVLAVGYNGFPRQVPDDPKYLLDRKEKYKRTIHAEANAVFNAAAYGVSLEGSHLYVYNLPVCSGCAPMIIQVGVKRVFMRYRADNITPRWRRKGENAVALFTEGGVKYARHVIHA